MNGPEISPDRAALNAATAARCAAVIFSAGIGGIRSCARAGRVAAMTAAAIIRNVFAFIVMRIDSSSVPHMVAYTEPSSMDHGRPAGRPLRVALVGFGYWGPNYARVLNDLPGVELTVVCDRSAERLAHVRTRYPAMATSDDLAGVLAGGRADAVVIATPASTHKPLVQAALETGHHVLVEKPMALDVAGCDTLCELAGASGRVLMVGYTFLYNAGVRKMKECMAADQF